ncbi:cytochrome P450 734A1 [Impatiens glandulifera]|uniref:cytochrome P450 734A1 n=1 Tax=Impatiens glandulifera TaxID=253017 RepID=UPI001FB194ED|nr:cytochrome P450 734A1 [Impatiens glandulifera]
MNYLPLVIIFLSFILLLILNLIHTILWVPLKIQRHFNKQGISGPNYRPIFGNSAQIRRRMISQAESKPMSIVTHDVVRRVMPHYYNWSTIYGKTFIYWFGSKARLAVSEPDMIKEILMDTNGCFGKVEFNPLSRLLFGMGLVGLSGDKWAFHRRITSQAFYMEKVKAWVPEMVESTKKMIKKWEEIREKNEEFEVEVHKEFHNLSADIISRTAFGSSFEEGRRVFELQDQQIGLALDAIRTIYIPGFKFLPTKKNRMRWKLERETRRSIMALIEKNGGEMENSKNLLSLLMSSYKNCDGEEERLTMDEVVDECKTFYFAGKDTTGNLLTWAIVLLAGHWEWQDKARREVIDVCKNREFLAPGDLSDLKNLGLILNETMRLYPPAVLLMRKATKDVKLGNLDVLRGTEFFLAMTAVHHDPEIWGSDSDKFNPERFMVPRKQIGSFFPFGMGPRLCVGQNLAMVEAKIVLAIIIREYSFRLSPSYVHAPRQGMTLEPQHGAHIIFSKIDEI